MDTSHVSEDSSSNEAPVPLSAQVSAGLSGMQGPPMLYVLFMYCWFIGSVSGVE